LFTVVLEAIFPTFTVPDVTVINGLSDVNTRETFAALLNPLFLN